VSAAEELWTAVSDLFAENDGSLPEIEIVGVSPEGAQAIFAEMMTRGRPLLRNPLVWDELTDEDVRIEDTPDAGLLAAQGRMRSLHVVLSGIEHSGVRLPDLGLSIDPEGIRFDYYMGSHWDPVTLAAFVELLDGLKRLGSGRDLVARSEVGSVSATLEKHFQAAVTRYLSVST
jgi:hypothetical protein